MRQQYFITVRTTGPHNANKSTKEMCNIVRRQYNNTLINGTEGIEALREVFGFMCDSINAKYPKNKAIKVGETWTTSYATDVYATDVCKTMHFVVQIDNHDGEGTFLQLDFCPVRHTYGMLLPNEHFTAKSEDYPKAKRYSDIPTIPPIEEEWSREKAKEGDILCDKYADEESVFILHHVHDECISMHCLIHENTRFGGSCYMHFNTESDKCEIIGSGNLFLLRYADEEQKGILFNELSVRGLRWNPTTLKIEKIEP